MKKLGQAPRGDQKTPPNTAVDSEPVPFLHSLGAQGDTQLTTSARRQMERQGGSQLVCPRCGGVCNQGVTLCPECRLPVGSSVTLPEHLDWKQSFSRIANNRWAIIGLLFGVMGPLAIPILWYSRAFTWPMKVALTVAVCLYIAVLGWLAWLAVGMAWHQMKQVL